MAEATEALIGKDKKVRIFAVKVKYRTGIPFYLTSVFDQTTNKDVYGWEDIKPVAEQNKLWKALGIQKETDLEELQVPIYHGMLLDPADPKGKAILLMCGINPAIARNRKSTNPDVHEYYLHDQEADDVEDVNIELSVLKAKNQVMELGSITKLRSLAIFLGGIDIAKLSVTSLQSRLLKEAGIRPLNVVEFFSGTQQNRMFVLELSHYGIVQQRQGVFFDGEVRLGSIVEATDYLSDPKHSEIANSLGERLNATKDKI